MAFRFRSRQSAGMIHGVPHRSRICPSCSAWRMSSGSGRMSHSRSRRNARNVGATRRVAPTSQSPENGSRLCKPGGPARLPVPPGRVSQSPENGSRLCKVGYVVWLIAVFRKYLSQSPENGSRLCKRSFTAAWDISPPSLGRNPLKTGLGTPTCLPDQSRGRGQGSWSQSPENGSRHSDEATVVIGGPINKVAIP